MKRILCAIVILIASLSGFAELLCDEINGVKFYYTIKDGEATLGDGSKVAIMYGNYGKLPYGMFTIPSKLGGCPVTKLNRCALFNGSNYSPLGQVSEIILPEGLKSIGDLAFGYCGFSSITIPGSVTSIGEKAFSSNNNLRKVVFNEGEGNLTLGDYALVAHSYYGWGPTTIIFHRDAPALGNESIPFEYDDLPTIWVRPTTKGWGVSIPGKWQGGNIKYLKSIDFDAGIGSVSAKTRWVTDGSKVDSLPEPTCQGHVFNGWYTTKSGGTKITSETTVSQNTIFYAQWTANKHEIRFDANGGDGGGVVTLDYGSEIGALPEVSKVGYNFNGWFTEKEGGVKISTETKVSQDVTYYAQWTIENYEVSFDANGGIGDSSLHLDYSSQIGLLPEPSRDGYAFKGWYTEKDGGQRISENTIVTADVTYYAHWVLSPYIFDGAAGWTVQEDESWKSGKINDNETSIMKLVVENNCKVLFSWKSSCEGLVKGRPYDYLSFAINDELQDFICGETDWEERSYEVKSGDTLCWTYQKDEQDGAGADCAWVKQVVVIPQVSLKFDGGDATDGEPPACMVFYKDDENVVLPDCGNLTLANHSFIGWSDGENIYSVGDTCPRSDADQTLTAVWSANRLSAPVISAPVTYEADFATVAITADEGAAIYYTLDGSEPNADAERYMGPFKVDGSATIRAVAIRDNYFDSQESQFTITRPTWTFGEYLNCPNNEFVTEKDDERKWIRVKGVSPDGYALKSGIVTHSQTSRVETVVYGSGKIRFSCKVEGEIVKKIVYDGLAFCIDGNQQGDLIGNVEWLEKEFEVTGDGHHILSWMYVKDQEGDGDGEDCAWLDCVTWIPTPKDPIPELSSTVTSAEVRSALEGSADVNLVENIKTAAEYAAYRTWALGLVGVTPDAVKASPNAWLSYALNTAALIAATPKEGDVLIDTFESAANAGTFEFAVKLDGIEVGANALEVNIRKVFDIEGAEKLVSGGAGFSPDNVEVNAAAPENGNVKFTVTPKGGGEGARRPTSFFFRVKMK